MKVEEKSTGDKIYGFLKLTTIILVVVLILGAIIIRSALDLGPNSAAPKSLNGPFIILSFIISIVISTWLTLRKMKAEEEKKQKATLENVKKTPEPKKQKESITIDKIV